MTQGQDNAVKCEPESGNSPALMTDFVELSVTRRPVEITFQPAHDATDQTVRIDLVKGLRPMRSVLVAEQCLECWAEPLTVFVLIRQSGVLLLAVATISLAYKDQFDWLRT